MDGFVSAPGIVEDVFGSSGCSRNPPHIGDVGCSASESRYIILSISVLSSSHFVWSSMLLVLRPQHSSSDRPRTGIPPPGFGIKRHTDQVLQFGPPEIILIFPCTAAVQKEE